MEWVGFFFFFFFFWGGGGSYGVKIWKFDDINNNVSKHALRDYQFVDAGTAESSCLIIFTSAKNLSNQVVLPNLCFCCHLRLSYSA